MMSAVLIKFFDLQAFLLKFRSMNRDFIRKFLAEIDRLSRSNLSTKFIFRIVCTTSLQSERCSKNLNDFIRASCEAYYSAEMFQGGMKSDSDDIFHDVVMSEERSQVEGYLEGLIVGKKAGLQEGYCLGWEKGAAINSELGFYYGFAKALTESLEKNPKSKQRAQKTLQSLIQKLEAFPRYDPQHLELQEQLASIRAKFKQLSSLLGLQPEFKRGDDVKGISF